MRRRKPVAGETLDLKQASQMIKLLAVMLRDNSCMSYHDAFVCALAYCWRHTSTLAQSIDREAERRG